MKDTVRKLAIIQIVLACATVTSAFLTEPYFPKELQNYLAKDLEKTPLVFDVIKFGSFGVATIAFFISLFGLILHKLWARKMFIGATIIIFPMCLFFGPNADNAVTYTLDQLSVLVHGMILSLLIFSDKMRQEGGHPSVSK